MKINLDLERGKDLERTIFLNNFWLDFRIVISSEILFDEGEWWHIYLFKSTQHVLHSQTHTCTHTHTNNMILNQKMHMYKICFIHKLILHIFMSVCQSWDLLNITARIAGIAAAEINVCWSAYMHCLRRRQFFALNFYLVFPPTSKTILGTKATFQTTRKYKDIQYLRKMFHFIICLVLNIEISLVASS